MEGNIWSEKVAAEILVDLVKNHRSLYKDRISSTAPKEMSFCNRMLSTFLYMLYPSWSNQSVTDAITVSKVS